MYVTRAANLPLYIEHYLPLTIGRGLLSAVGLCLANAFDSQHLLATVARDSRGCFQDSYYSGSGARLVGVNSLFDMRLFVKSTYRNARQDRFGSSSITSRSTWWQIKLEALKDWDVRDWIEELLNPSNMFLVSFMETNGEVKLWSHLYRKVLECPSPSDPNFTNAAAKASWKSPPIGWLKMNFDSTFKDGEAATTCVTRDHEGTIILIWISQDPSNSEDITNAQASVQCLKLAENSKSSKIIVCRDDPMLIQGGLIAPHRTIAGTGDGNHVGSPRSATETMPGCQVQQPRVSMTAESRDRCAVPVSRSSDQR
ncbi:hypothetical protein M9H77_08532 [Catharanthus roseus]|uniref:Uncharacterized protein n=1 Tax=Catharanthus roseus TaxID=4058 RepID=A0ACC0BY86_CATRO|nr:hypothetical protein M9H77_08532 [Catharanthus roseus]